MADKVPYQDCIEDRPISERRCELRRKGLRGLGRNKDMPTCLNALLHVGKTSFNQAGQMDHSGISIE